MRLCEHPDFSAAILRAEIHFAGRGLRAAIIEKDYYVTETLREIARDADDHVIFKGGTSLSKGWGLIERFSEDIDLFLDPQSFVPKFGSKRVDGWLKRLRDAVPRVPGLELDKQASRSWKGQGRTDSFRYVQRFADAGGVANRVLLEAGVASGREPTEVRQLTSLLAQFLHEVGATLGAADEQPFPMKLLHFRRTFVEKLFAIHGKVEKARRTGASLGSYARHYYDLHRLAGLPEVRSMLASAEYGRIQADYEAISLAHFPRDYACPEGKDFTKSVALFPQGALRQQLGREYTRQCQALCYGTFAAWEEVLAAFEDLRPLLRAARD